jgi:hypothetical protein
MKFASEGADWTDTASYVEQFLLTGYSTRQARCFGLSHGRDEAKSGSDPIWTSWSTSGLSTGASAGPQYIS